MTARSAAPVARALGGASILLVVGWWVGPSAVLEALAALDVRTAAVALACTLVATVASAWRWTVLARRAGLPLALTEAVPAYYRSQLLNATLPLGVIGDVDRAWHHGRASSRRGLAGRTVVTDRVAGQVVAVLLAGSLAATAPALRLTWLAGTGVWVAGACAAALLGLLVALPEVVATSVIAAGAHATTFVVAARSVGAEAPLSLLVPLALLVLAGGALPVNVAGWGPREGVAAWAFATVGLGAGIGLAAAVVHGLVSLVAVAPGVAFLGRRTTAPAAPAAVPGD